MVPRGSGRLLRHAATSTIFTAGFLGAYLSTILLSTYTSAPANLWIGGDHGFQLRPEPVLLPLAVAFGWPGVVGTTAGILLHNLLFRLVPSGVTLTFSLAQTVVAGGAGYTALLLRRRVPRPYNNLAATWAMTAFFVIILGIFSSMDYPDTTILHEWDHIFREVLIPFNILGLIILEGLEVWKRPVSRELRGAAQ